MGLWHGFTQLRYSQQKLERCVWLDGIGFSLLSVPQVAYSISSAVNWLTQILLNQVTPVAMARIEWRYYFLFVVTNIVSAGALLLLYPETNGKSLEQMDEVRPLPRFLRLIC